MEVMVENNNGNQPYSITVTYGENMPYFIAPIKTGYEFEGYILYSEDMLPNIPCYDREMNSLCVWNKAENNYILYAQKRVRCDFEGKGSRLRGRPPPQKRSEHSKVCGFHIGL